MAQIGIHILHVNQLGRRLSKLFSPLILISAIWSDFPVNKCEHLLNIILGGGVRRGLAVPQSPRGVASLAIATIVPLVLGGPHYTRYQPSTNLKLIIGGPGLGDVR